MGICDRREVIISSDLKNSSIKIAENILELAQTAIADRGFFTFALAGGNTPRLLYESLASEYADRIPWHSVHLFWGDERYVPMDHPESNYAMAFQTLISKISIPLENVHRIPTEIEPLEKAAASYEDELRKILLDSGENAISHSFDLILLGVGEDGHTASLFPGDLALKEKKRWVLPVYAPSSYSIRPRITLTLPLINNSNNIFFLVSGAKRVG